MVRDNNCKLHIFLFAKCKHLFHLQLFNFVLEILINLSIIFIVILYVASTIHIFVSIVKIIFPFLIGVFIKYLYKQKCIRLGIVCVTLLWVHALLHLIYFQQGSVHHSSSLFWSLLLLYIV